jgi:hypothetical protein
MDQGPAQSARRTLGPHVPGICSGSDRSWEQFFYVPEAEAELTPGSPQLVADRWVGYLPDNVLSLVRGVIAPDRRSALLADEVTVLERCHRPG